LQARGYLPCAALRDTPDGRRVAIAGLVLAQLSEGANESWCSPAGVRPVRERP